MRALEVALTSLALRLGAPRPPRWERRLVPAVDDANPAFLDRAALNQQQAALIASLWPETRPCVVAARYEQLPAPALFVAALCVSWQPPDGAHCPPLAEGEVQVAHAYAG